MTKLHEREPKPGDRFKLKNGEIVSFGALFPDNLGILQRLAVVCEGAMIRYYSYPSGQYCHTFPSEHDIDCYVEEQKTIKAWVNVYNSGFSCSYAFKGVANEMSRKNRLACKEIEITYTPGEGLS